MTKQIFKLFNELNYYFFKNNMAINKGFNIQSLKNL